MYVIFNFIITAYIISLLHFTYRNDSQPRPFDDIIIVGMIITIPTCGMQHEPGDHSPDGRQDHWQSPSDQVVDAVTALVVGKDVDGQDVVQMKTLDEEPVEHG